MLNLLYHSQSARLIGEDFIVRDYSIGLLFALAIFLFIWKITYNLKKEERFIIFFSWIFRVFVVMDFLTFILENYYKGANDAFSHYKIALGMKNPFFHISGNTYNFRVFLYYILKLTFDSFHGAKTFMAFIGFLGSWFFFLGISKYYNNIKHRLLLDFFIFNWPSIVFWTSNLYKDSLNFFFYGVFTYLIILFFKNEVRWYHILLGGVTCFLVFPIRPLGVILYAITFSIVWGWYFLREKHRLCSKVIVVLGGIGAIFLVFWFLKNYYGINFIKGSLYFVSNYYYRAKFHINILHKVKVFFIKTITNTFSVVIFILSSYSAIAYLMLTRIFKRLIFKIIFLLWSNKVLLRILPFTSILKIYTPLVLISFSNFFRPFPWEIKNIFMAIASAEGLVFIGLFILLVWKILKYPKILISKDKLLTFFLVFLLLWFMSAGVLSSWNLGLFTRYRIQIVIPYLVIVFKAYSFSLDTPFLQ